MERSGRYIPSRLKYFRRLMQLTQYQVADRLGIKSASRISQWEKGLCMPSVENLIKLSAIYHTLVNELYDELYKQALKEQEEFTKSESNAK